MVDKLFERFLDDPTEYQASEHYWQALVADVTHRAGQAGEWTPWMPRNYGNGMPMERDGNPIYDGRSSELDRAFRIMQHRPVSDSVEVGAWVKEYEAEYTELPRSELVLNLSLSTESADLARALLQKWIMPLTTPEDMESFIEQTIGPQ